MEQTKIDRINFLARKAKTQGLDDAELAEQAALRREYIEAYRASLQSTLDRTVIQRPDGTCEKLTRKS